MSNTVERAMVDMAWALAHKAHAGQIYARKDCNWEYITHLKRVVHNIGNCGTITLVAILHDVVEDSDVTVKEITRIFGTAVGDAVDAITRRQEENGDWEAYGAYIERCRENSIARMVKAVDIADHILHCVKPDAPDNWRSMLDRYVSGMHILFAGQ